MRLAPTSRSSSVVLWLALALAVVGGGACGGGGGDDAPEAPPAAPAANVDPKAGGVVGGPINRAKDVAGDAESRDARLEESGGGGGATSSP